MVAAESPSFIESPEETVTVAEGQSAMFTCNVYGAPRPTLVWRKGPGLVDVRDLHDRRISVLPNGNLKIEVLLQLQLIKKTAKCVNNAKVMR